MRCPLISELFVKSNDTKDCSLHLGKVLTFGGLKQRSRHDKHNAEHRS